MHTTSAAASLSLLVLLAACDTTPPAAQPDRTTAPSESTTGEPDRDETSAAADDERTTGAAGETSAADESTSDAPTGDAVGDTSGGASTGDTSGADDTGADDEASTSGGSQPPVAVDLFVLVDVSPGMLAPLTRLTDDVVAVDTQLSVVHGVDVRWIVVAFADASSAVEVSTDVVSARTTLSYWAGFTQAGPAGMQPDLSGNDNEEADDAGLSALGAAVAWDGWRPDAARLAVVVTDSAPVEGPAVLSGYEVTADTTAAVVGAQAAEAGVHVVAWAPADAAWPVDATHDIAGDLDFIGAVPEFAVAAIAADAEAADTDTDTTTD